jgi:hypothetical protein
MAARQPAGPASPPPKRGYGQQAPASAAPPCLSSSALPQQQRPHLARQALARVTPVTEQAVSVNGGEQRQALKAGTRPVASRQTPG